MKRLFALALGLFLPAPARAADPPDKPGVVEKADKKPTGESIVAERIVAVVNHEIILLTELKDRAVMLGQPIDDSGNAEARRKSEQQLRQVLDRMVDDTLVSQQAIELKLNVEASEIDRAVDEVKKQNNLTDEQFAEALGTQGYSLASYRKDMKKQLLRLKVINTAVRSHISISEEDVRAFYDQGARRAGGHRSAHVRHVLVALPPGVDERTVEQRRKIATRVVEGARGGTEFAQLAKSFSDDEFTRDKEGDLGWVEEGGGLPEALSEVIFTMDVKDIRGPIRTERGFEIVQLLEKKDADLRPFNEVKDQIKQQLYAQQLEKQTLSWLQELRKKAHIDVRL